MQDFITLAQKLAEHLADEAGKIIRPYFRQSIEVDHKSDDSPVTIADRTVEQRLRQIIEELRPEDGIIGEEFGLKESKNQYEWVLDPIDGTKSFIAGRPSFGTLIALCENGVPILGIINQPILNERWVGAKGMPTTFNGKVVKTSSCHHLKHAKLASTGPYMFPDHWEKLYNNCDFMIWGGDCYSFGLLANGNIDAIVEGKLSFYDFAALVPIIEGAGGWIGDWDGNTLHKNSDGMIVTVGDIALKDQILGILK